jgi:hypothetical protein
MLRTRPTFLLLALVVAAWGAAGQSSLAAKLYWAGQSIGRMDLDGSNAQTLVPSADALQLAIDTPRGKMYWASGGSSAGDHLFRANLDGSGVETIGSFYTVQGGVAVDSARNLLYWGGAMGGPPGEFELYGVNAVDLSDLSSSYLFEAGVTRATFHLNRAGDLLHIVDTDDAVLGHHTLDGARLPLSASAIGFAIGPGETHIYWSDSGALTRANPNGTDATQVGALPYHYVQAMTIDPESEKLYFGIGDVIYRANLDATGIEEVYRGVYAESLMIVPEPGALVLGMIGIAGAIWCTTRVGKADVRSPQDPDDAVCENDAHYSEALAAKERSAAELATN